jgi:hypothetical protein
VANKDNEPASPPPSEPLLDDLHLRAAQLDLDRDRFRFEQEIETKKLRTSIYSNGIILALVGAFAAILSSSLQGYFNLRLERQKAQASITLKAIETGSAKDAANNLLFLVRAGLLDDPAHRLEALLKKPDEVPVLPARLGQEGLYLKADLNAYCRSRYGPLFRAAEGKCLDGVNEYKIEPAEVCTALTGSAEYSIDSASMEIHCNSGGSLSKGQR